MTQLIDTLTNAINDNDAARTARALDDAFECGALDAFECGAAAELVNAAEAVIS